MWSATAPCCAALWNWPNKRAEHLKPEARRRHQPFGQISGKDCVAMRNPHCAGAKIGTCDRAHNKAGMGFPVGHGNKRNAQPRGDQVENLLVVGCMGRCGMLRSALPVFCPVKPIRIPRRKSVSAWTIGAVYQGLAGQILKRQTLRPCKRMVQRQGHAVAFAHYR